MNILSPQSVETRTTSQEAEQIARIGTIASEILAKTQELNGITETYETEKTRIEGEMDAIRSKAEKEKRGIVEELASLRETRAEAMKPVDALLLTARETNAAADSRTEGLDAREAELEQRETELMERLESLQNRAGELDLREYDLTLREERIEDSEERFGATVRKFVEDRAVFTTSALEEKARIEWEHQQLDTERKELAAMRAILDQEGAELGDGRRLLHDAYQQLERTKLEINGAG